MNLNLGCSDSLKAGYVNVDVCPPADFLADLTQPWPWADESIEMIRACDIIEHLPDKFHTMNEAFRVLKSGGRMEIVVPTTGGDGAFQDPQHCSYWNVSSFQYYVDDPKWPAESLHRIRFGKAYGVKARFHVKGASITNYDATVFGIRVHVPKLAIVLEKP
jgi:predicted SAM-dependent methyltransferase